MCIGHHPHQSSFLILLFFVQSEFDKPGSSQCAARGAARQERVAGKACTTGSSSTSPPLPPGREAVGIRCHAQNCRLYTVTGYGATALIQTWFKIDNGLDIPHLYRAQEEPNSHRVLVLHTRHLYRSSINEMLHSTFSWISWFDFEIVDIDKVKDGYTSGFKWPRLYLAVRCKSLH